MSRLVFYTYPSCTSCRKTKAWLKQHHVEYEERHLFKETPDIEELFDIIKLTHEGIKDILATRSETFKKLNIDLDELKVSEVLQLLHDEPRLLRRPILTDGQKLVVGFNKSGLQKLGSKDLSNSEKNVS
ncbi:Spx/MgsR family RNA polymerase-binding regulatory protein [Pullulanibacillus sp. KACC 23026]|uniref:Spx/MgsR family RNA polymerase-binding regulatory protein n=1 Tax=Pullulanibacillus sp. KACC 23026 TaxID=3028315 RepID=UPI0023B07C18|nr:Spx/MgsR family RNA polymerase-binding regulatory protein [Pullulanibacillus sp. KACC 23026]WEG14282.1 Spx/MgsR family RNA polymerase-binding regulatory protein [Pullulanibacillus sp. KACC 23026]